MDIRENKPFTTNQIKNEKPSVPKTESVLSGYIANSFNAGHDRVIAWKQVMAGEKIKEYRLQAKFQMLTPITPSYQNLIMTIRTYFVPNSRIWKNAEKFTAQKESGAEIKITKVPNAGGKIIPTITAINNTNGQNTKTYLSNTDIWRDAYISCYYPRIRIGIKNDDITGIPMPEVSILPLRGRRAIYNDLERNRDFDFAEVEYNDDEVSQEEWESYLPNKFELKDMRAKRNNSYYTNYRTSIQGFESEFPPEDMSADKSLITWAAWESKIAEARSEAQNAQMTDWDIIAKIRGSKKLTEGKVQLIGEVSFPLNYAAITQNTYNNNENIREDFRVLGKQGAYSYTEINKSIFAGFESVEEGYIHIIATVSADTVFENAFNRLELNVNALEQYRPDLKDDKFDILYQLETDADYPEGNYKMAKGFKRKYTEYFKLNNIVSGDMHNVGFFNTDISTLDGINFEFIASNEIIPNSTFQFFETSEYTYKQWIETMNYEGLTELLLKPWKDYTDLQVNKNQAIKNTVSYYSNDIDQNEEIQVKGQNQIFFVGKCLCVAILPIDEKIKNEFTQWGEH